MTHLHVLRVSVPDTDERNTDWGYFSCSHDLQQKYQLGTTVQDVLALKPNYTEFPIFVDIVSSIFSHKNNNKNSHNVILDFFKMKRFSSN